MEVIRITDLEAFQETRELWNDFLRSSGQNCIFLTHEWFLSWWKSFSEEKSLEILLFKDKEDGLVGIAPLMREGNILRFMASREVTDYCDFIVLEGKEKEFFDSLFDYLKSQYSEIRSIELWNIKQSSPTLLFLPQLAPHHDFSFSSLESDVTPVLSLPSSYEKFLMLLGRKSRHELKRKLRRMEALEGLRNERIKDPKELQTAVRAFIHLHRKSGKAKEKFWKRKGMEDFFQELVLRFSQKGWVELNFLFHQEKIMASLLSFLYEDTLYFYNITYSRDYAWYSPGLYLFHKRLKHAIEEKKKQADFLRGREKYKYVFGAKESKILDLTLICGVSRK